METSVDAFYRGKVMLEQLVARGHRVGMDALILAACVDEDFEGRLADFGAGIGAVGLCAHYRAPKSSVLFIENQKEMIALLDRNIDRNSVFCTRSSTRIIDLDLEENGAAREAAGLTRWCCDHVLMNPPFYDPQNFRPSPDSMRVDAHMMKDEGLERWMKAALYAVKPKGHISFILPATDLSKILNLSENRLGAVTVRPIHSFQDMPAIRILVSGKVGSRAPMQIITGLVLKDRQSNEQTEIAEHILNGRSGAFETAV